MNRITIWSEFPLVIQRVEKRQMKLVLRSYRKDNHDDSPKSIGVN